MKQKIISIFNENDFEDNSFSYCIKSFYNSTSKIIKEYKEKDFYFPIISHGIISNPNRNYYSIFYLKIY